VLAVRGIPDFAMNSKTLHIALVAVLAGLLSLPAAAGGRVTVTDPWVRATAPGQAVAGAFMEITSPDSAALVAVTTPVASAVELHTMKIDGGVMKMRAVERIELPAGQPVKFAPGAFHLMLVDLKHPLTKGDRVPLTLTIENNVKVKTVIEVSAEVRENYGAGKRRPH
jgi:periplasmic copper chaperone A